jgi:hypothetical protein
MPDQECQLTTTFSTLPCLRGGENNLMGGSGGAYTAKTPKKTISNDARL